MPNPPIGVARYVGSLPTDPDDFMSMIEVGDAELYRVDPPLRGYHVVAATQMLWAIRARCVGDEVPDDDPVSTTFFGVSGGEDVRIERDRQLAERADGMSPVRALGELGYAVR